MTEAAGGVMNEYDRKYHFPVYGTQGGGIVREAAKGICVFVEEPVGSGLNVGDTMPPEWSITPANQLAMEQMIDDQFGTKEELEATIRRGLIRGWALESRR